MHFVHYNAVFIPETHTKRQVSQHDCLPSLLGNVDKWIEIVYSEEKNIFVLGRVEQPRQDKKLALVRAAHRTNQRLFDPHFSPQF